MSMAILVKESLDPALQSLIENQISMFLKERNDFVRMMGIGRQIDHMCGSKHCIGIALGLKAPF